MFEAAMHPVTIAALYLYPVKSARGHAVAQAELDRHGLVGDRRFLVVDEQGKFVTQRETPSLALITPQVKKSGIIFTRAGASDLAVAHPRPGAPTRDVIVWRDRMRAVDLGDDVAAWLTEALARPVRLVGTGGDFSRPISPPAGQAGDELAFADGFPLLVLGEASLDELNGRLDFPVPMNRFRPNLVVRGAAAFAEDTWRRIRIGTVVLRAAGPCERCVVTTTDQETLMRDKEPLRTLATYRRDERGGVCFGQNYINESKTGTIQVGDPVEILA